MEPFAIGLVAIIVFISICVAKRKKKRKAAKLSEYDKVPKISTTLNQDIAPAYKGPAPNVIYVFSGNRMTVSCPFCDGENDINAASCAICGEKIASGKRY